jgi:hypothetical protein
LIEKGSFWKFLCEEHPNCWMIAKVLTIFSQCS